jgi:hypothetical protein
MCAAVLTALVTAVFAFAYSMPEHLLPVLPETSAEQEPVHAKAVQDPEALCAAAEEASAGGYLIRLDGDLLRVFAEGSRTPAAEYALPAGWLPDYDRILLEYGIRVKDTAELRDIIEDYIS